VSASLATRLWPGQNAVGKRFRRGPDDSPPIAVVGVAGDVRASTLEQPAGLIAYVPFWQMPTSQVSLAVKAIVEPANLASAIRDAIRTVDPRLPLAGVRTMDAVVADALGERRFLTSLVLLFAMAAVMLAAVGIYGIVSQGVAQRAPEIGLRVALGARGSQVRLMVLRDVWKLLGIGLTAGVWLVLGIGAALKSVLFNVLPNDAGTIAAACLVLAGAATLAAYIPARRAASVNPIVALRSE
jgi:ABC-type antimicrobial peptide transport system permease subunit